MLSFRLSCPCGYLSNIVSYGRELFSPVDYYVPVIVDGDEELHHICIKLREGESEEAFFDRLDSSTEECFAQQFGENATLMTPLDLFGEQILKCPRCGQERAKFVSAGF
ncbi:hypothetical protein [Gimesia panareensis]|uniref:hypothetical protein n=1 Tax=Gimesia panareensis TaxID=2527978 RepID=UPI0011A7EAB7|nr:hypothetical protein [Gimesia panareensis]